MFIKLFDNIINKIGFKLFISSYKIFYAKIFFIQLIKKKFVLYEKYDDWIDKPKRENNFKLK